MWGFRGLPLRRPLKKFTFQSEPARPLQSPPAYIFRGVHPILAGGWVSSDSRPSPRQGIAPDRPLSRARSKRPLPTVQTEQFGPRSVALQGKLESELMSETFIHSHQEVNARIHRFTNAPCHRDLPPRQPHTCPASVAARFPVCAPKFAFIELCLHRLAGGEIRKTTHEKERVGIFDRKKRPQDFHPDFGVCWNGLRAEYLKKP